MIFFNQNSVNGDPRTYDFTKDWAKYWVQRIQVYYNEAMQKIIDTIGANYNFTLRETNTTEAVHTENAQHSNGNCVNSGRNEEKQAKTEDLANYAHVNRNQANVTATNADSVDDAKSKHSLNADTFSITSDKPISTGNDNNVIEIGKLNVLNSTFSKLYVLICMKPRELFFHLFVLICFVLIRVRVSRLGLGI